MKTSPAQEAMRRALPYLVVAAFAALFGALTVPAFDSDFWWHLASGRWMWEHRALLRTDPFDFTSAIFGSSSQVRYQLTQYWGAQVLLYGSYLLAGLKGVALLRAAVFTALFALLFRLLRRTGAGMPAAVLLLGVGVQAIVRELVYINDRPQMWSSLCFVALLLLIELLREGRRWARLALPLLMLLWANLHAGYILGVIVIAIAAAAAQLSRHGERRRIIPSAAAAVALAGVNPAGFEALTAFPLALLAGPTPAAGGIYEFESLFKYLRVTALPGAMPALAACFLLPLLTVLPRIPRLLPARWDLLLIYLFTLGAGIRSQRYLVFMVPMACWMTAANLAALRERLPAALQGLRAGPWPRVAAGALTAAALLAMTAAYARVAARWSVLRPSASYRHEAEGAADYLKRGGFKGNLFNEYGIGGYLAWRLHPDAKVFIYGRAPYPELLALYNEVLHNPGKTASLTSSGQVLHFYRKVLDENAVDAVVIPAGDSRSGEPVLLAVRLARDEDWALVRAEPAALVFLRKKPELAPLVRRALPKSAVFDAMIAVALEVSRSSHGRSSLVWRRTLVLAHYGKGQKREALRVFDEYGKLAPYGADDLKLREEIAAEVGLEGR